MRLIIAIGLVLAAAGCVTAGRKLDQAKVDQIKNGTSQADVRKLIGAPDTVTRDASGGSIWFYQFMQLTPKGENFVPVVNIFASGYNTKHQTLMLYFDQAGSVTNLISSSGASEVGAGASAGSSPNKESMAPVTAGKRAK